MKVIIRRFLQLVKSLFLKLRVIVTLQVGKDKVDKLEEDDHKSINCEKGIEHEKESSSKTSKPKM